MNKIKILLGALCLCAVTATAQTNTTAGPVETNLLGAISNPTISGGFQEICDAATTSTNSAVALGGGRGLKGDYNLLFLDYLYNFNANAGLLLGFDDIAHGSKFTTDNIAFVKGGFNVQAQIAPFKNMGLPNFTVTPFAALLMDSGNGRIGQIAVAGVNKQFVIGKGWDLNVGGFYENRSGDGLPTDGAYICGHLAVSKGF